MAPVLLLIDLQQDYLAAPGLQPAAGQVVEGATRLLDACRRLAVPVVHVLTTVQRDPDNRMPHWRAANKWPCEAGTPGHQPPPSLRPMTGESIVHKQFFSGFGSPDLESILRSLKCDTLILAGVHTHGCVRATALDAYERGYQIWIAEDAIGSDDPLQAAITRRYLTPRGSSFAPIARLAKMIEQVTRDTGLRPVPVTLEVDQSGVSKSISTQHGPEARVTGESRVAAEMARRSWPTWRNSELTDRERILRRLADLLLRDVEPLAQQLTHDIGKPITMSRGEIARSAALLHAVADRATESPTTQSTAGTTIRYQPLGVVAVVTPWNNPIAIPIGKIAPALLYGNTVVWKPSPPATAIAQRLMALFREAGWRAGDDDLVALCTGDQSASLALASDANVHAVTLSGSLQAGYALHEACIRRHIPYQGELGGNNAAVICEDADVRHAAEQIAAGAFGFAGQRCTANRRAIVMDSIFDRFMDDVKRATAALRWGDPLDPATMIGPLIGIEKRDAVAALLQRTQAAGSQVVIPHRQQANHDELIGGGAYQPPAIVIAHDSSAEIVQEETFGPVLVVQRAKDFDHALQLLNGVQQGLVAAVFTASPALQQRFLAEAQAGVLKINRSTVDADAVSPLGGWKASGVGPAEHGPSDREFFCRVQTIYQ